MCVQTCVFIMSAGMCVNRRRPAFVCTCVAVCVDMCVGMCIDVPISVCIGTQQAHICACVRTCTDSQMGTPSAKNVAIARPAANIADVVEPPPLGDIH